MLTAYLQSFDFADRVTVRHAATFVVGLAGVAALLPLGHSGARAHTRARESKVCPMPAMKVE